MIENFCESLIKQDISKNCYDPITQGIESNGVIMNRKDVDFGNVIFDDIRPNVIKTIPLKDGAKAYKIYVPGPTPFNNTTTTMETGPNRNTFTHDVGMVVLNHDPDICDKIIDPMANGEFVIIYENKFKNFNKPTTPGDSAFQIVGYYQGLRGKTLENNKYSAETEGGWNILLEESKSPRSGLFLYNTDYDTTEQQIQTLLNPV